MKTFTGNLLNQKQTHPNDRLDKFTGQNRVNVSHSNLIILEKIYGRSHGIFKIPMGFLFLTSYFKPKTEYFK